MNDAFEKLVPLAAATVIAWLCVAVVALLNIHVFVSGAAAILAIIATVTIWTMWALDQVGISLDGQPQPRERDYEKAKRDDAGDPRAALLLALLTPDERAALKQRLADELRGDGEALTLAQLLAEQDRTQTGRSS